MLNDIIAIYSFLFLLGGVGVVVIWYHFIYLRKLKKYREAEIFEFAFDNLSDCIFILDNNKYFILCNQSFVDFVGGARADVIGKNIKDIFLQDVCEQFSEIDSRIRVVSNKFKFEVSVQTVSGKCMECEAVLATCGYDSINAVMYVLRDIHEQNRVLNNLLKRDKLLYALTCRIQKVLDNSQSFEEALDRALQVFSIGAEIEEIILAQSVNYNSSEENMTYDDIQFKVTNIVGENDRSALLKGRYFNLESGSIKVGRVAEQEKIAFFFEDKIQVIDESAMNNKEIIGYYAITIYCQGIKWGILLLACSDLNYKWDEEIEEAIETFALQLGVLLERRNAEEVALKTVIALKKSNEKVNMALKIAGAASFEYDILLDNFDIDANLFEKLEYGKDWRVSSIDDIKKIIHEADIDRWHKKISLLLNGECAFITDDVRLMMRSGRYLWVTMNARTIVENDVVCALTGVFHNLDEKMVRQN